MEVEGWYLFCCEFLFLSALHQGSDRDSRCPNGDNRLGRRRRKWTFLRCTGQPSKVHNHGIHGQTPDQESLRRRRRRKRKRRRGGGRRVIVRDDHQCLLLRRQR